MKNNYRHMNDGTTRIEVMDVAENVEVIIDTEDFELISSIPGSWAVWKRNDPKSSPMIATTLPDKKSHTMHRLITNCPKGKVVYNINRNFLDLRKKNLLIANVGETNSRAFMVKVEQLLKERDLDRNIQSDPEIKKESQVPQPNSLMIQEIKTYVIRNGNGDSIILNEDEFKALKNYHAV